MPLVLRNDVSVEQRAAAWEWPALLSCGADLQKQITQLTALHVVPDNMCPLLSVERFAPVSNVKSKRITDLLHTDGKIPRIHQRLHAADIMMQTNRKSLLAELSSSASSQCVHFLCIDNWIKLCWVRRVAWPERYLSEQSPEFLNGKATLHWICMSRETRTKIKEFSAFRQREILHILLYFTPFSCTNASQSLTTVLSRAALWNLRIRAESDGSNLPSVLPGFTSIQQLKDRRDNEDFK